MYTYYISVGSNIGDKSDYINSAFQSLQQHGAISKLVTSSLIELSRGDIRNKIPLLMAYGLVKAL